MKTLLLLRHAMSVGNDPAIDDHDRPLTPGGQRAAIAMGKLIIARSLQPDLILCSSATRARHTLELLGDWVPNTRLQTESALYLASSHLLFRQLQRIGKDSACPLIIGHNPGIADLARLLAGAGNPASRKALSAGFPPAALAVIRITTANWADMTPAEGRLEAFIRPRDIANSGQ